MKNPLQSDARSERSVDTNSSTADRILHALAQERTEENTIRDAVSRAIAAGYAPERIRDLVAGLIDLKRSLRGDRVLVDGVSVPWDVAACYIDEQRRHARHTRHTPAIKYAQAQDLKDAGYSIADLAQVVDTAFCGEALDNEAASIAGVAA